MDLAREYLRCWVLISGVFCMDLSPESRSLSWTTVFLHDMDQDLLLDVLDQEDRKTDRQCCESH